MIKPVPLLSIIIVSYNTADLTIQTLDSTLKSIANSKLLKNSTEIFIIDNASTDESLKKISSLTNKHKNLKLIKNKKNLGFAQANNQAAQNATGEYLLLLNSDTIVLDNALENLVQTAITKNLDIAAAQLLNPDKTLQPQGGSFPSLFSIFNHFLFIDDLPFFGKFVPSTQHTGKNSRHSTPDWVGGTAMLITKKTWKENIGLDNKIFMYGEDIEFCLRAYRRSKQTLKINIAKNAQIIHLGSASSSHQNALHGEIKSYLYIWQKHYPTWQLPILKIILKIGIRLRTILFGMILRDNEKYHAYRTALDLF